MFYFMPGIVVGAFSTLVLILATTREIGEYFNVKDEEPSNHKESLKKRMA